MKKKLLVLIFSCGILTLLAYDCSHAYWVWTPETKKFVNPKYAVKDSPKEQFDWAMSFYNTNDYQRAANEFERLVKHYEYSEYASKAQYYAGLSYESLGKYYTAFQSYQKVIDHFPHIENLEEIISRQFNIANLLMSKISPKVLGLDILTDMERAIEIYKKVVENAPYGTLAPEAQFRLAEAFKKGERFEEAIEAFQKIIDDYPNSQFYDRAKFEAADCAYKASLKPAYDMAGTTKAIAAFRNFSATNKDEELSKKADATISRLVDKSAEKSFQTAQFYETQKRYQSAIVYYMEVVNKYPESSFADTAKARIQALEDKLKKK